jgi:inorganic pyrophosphatase
MRRFPLFFAVASTVATAPAALTDSKLASWQGCSPAEAACRAKRPFRALSPFAPVDLGVERLAPPYNRGAFDRDLLRRKASGSRDPLPSIDKDGKASTFRVHYEYAGTRISPWHDVPLVQSELAGPDGRAVPLFHFLCEIPRGTSAKMELVKEIVSNPIAQDVRDGRPRRYEHGHSLVNYGALMQTWEDPNRADPDTGVGGDNDPIDVLQIGYRPCEVGEIQRVRVLGGLALIDGGETDWKIIVADEDEDLTHFGDGLWDIEDVERMRPGLVGRLREWFRVYKVAEGKPPNRFGLGGRAVDAAHARRVVFQTHAQWHSLIVGSIAAVTANSNSSVITDPSVGTETLTAGAGTGSGAPRLEQSSGGSWRSHVESVGGRYEAFARNFQTKGGFLHRTFDDAAAAQAWIDRIESGADAEL